MPSLSFGGAVRRVVAAGTALVLVCASPAWSQAAAESQGDAAQQALAQAYVAAVNAGDAVALRGLLHPAVRACIDDATRPMFDWIVTRELRAGPRSSSFRIAPVGAPGTWTATLPQNLLRYPVEPTHEIQWELAMSETRSRTVIRQIAMADGAWFIVLPCPTPEGVEAFRRKQSESGR